jgi:hypothetical protein
MHLYLFVAVAMHSGLLAAAGGGFAAKLPGHSAGAGAAAATEAALAAKSTAVAQTYACLLQLSYVLEFGGG